MVKKIVLCLAGGCPTAYISGNYVKIIDDSRTIRVSRNSEEVVSIEIPLEWIRKIAVNE